MNRLLSPCREFVAGHACGGTDRRPSKEVNFSGRCLPGPRVGASFVVGMSRSPHPFRQSESADTIKVLADDFRQYLKSGLYRHFSSSGELLYVGETDNFLARSLTHLESRRGEPKYTQ